MKKRLAAVVTAIVLSLCCGALLAACGDPVPAEAKSVKAIVWGYEWGPAVPKVVVEFSDNVSDVDKDTFAVRIGTKNRTVLDAYKSDKDGNKTTEETKFVTVETDVKYGESSPFVYDQNKQMNDWAESIAIRLTVKGDFKVGKTACEKDQAFSLKAEAKDRVVPQTASWKKDTVKYTKEGKEQVIQRASWAPAGADSDGGKNPLVIWLHGMGEGGTDIDIALLGNEVTALTSENETSVQKYFTTDTLKGAYVLALQSPTMWMDDGSGEMNVDKPGAEKQTSYYTEIVWKAITDYVDNNPDVDTSRIYLGGCSNGGYMTMNMAFEHGDYFAAFYPICEAYNNSKISDAMINDIKGYNMWFIQSHDDTTVVPSKFVYATYDRLLKAGAANMHLTVTDHVYGKDDPHPSAGWGTSVPDTYMGHWVWITAFNDEIKKEVDNSAITKPEDIKPEICTKDGNVWKWLSEQTKPIAGGGTDYVLEAEAGVITDGITEVSPGWGQPAVDTPASVKVETANKYTGSEAVGDAVTSLGYFTGIGTKVEWTITVEEACDVVLTLYAAAAIQDQSGVTDWGTGEGLKMSPVDLSKNEYLKLSVGGVDQALSGTLPGIDGLNWSALNPSLYHNYGTGTVKVHLEKGANTITLSSVHKTIGINIDKLVVNSPVEVTFTPTDNSSRVPQPNPDPQPQA